MEHRPDRPHSDPWSRLSSVLEECMRATRIPPQPNGVINETDIDPWIQALNRLDECTRTLTGPDPGLRNFRDLVQGLRRSLEASAARLQQSELRHRLIAESAHEAIYDWNLAANRLEWSSGMQTVLGHTAESIQNDIDWWKKNLHPKDHDRVVASLEGAIERKQKHWEEEYWFRRGDGDVAAILDRGIFLYDSGGNATQMVGSMLDITERKLREEDRMRFLAQIQEQQKRLSDLVRNVPGVVWEISGAPRSATVKVTFVSDHIEQILGYPAEEWVKDPGYWLRLLHPDDVAPMVAMIEDTYLTAESRVIILRYRHKQGAFRWLEIRACGIRDPEGNPAGIRGVTTDVTERIEAENLRESLLVQTRQALQLRDEFIAIASHELKTPLTSLQAQSQSLLKLHQDGLLKTLPPDTLTQLLEIGNQQTQRLAGLVRDLLDVSRVSVGKLQLQCREVELKEVVQRVLDRYQPDLELSQCALELTVSGSTLGYWDPDRLDQVFTNLLSNAMKYGRAKPIRIRIEGAGAEVVLSVQDHGTGIAAHDQSRIFERFERGSAHRNIPGLGLGLYISREIVGMHGGRIEVESALGQGALFRVVLPRHA